MCGRTFLAEFSSLSEGTEAEVGSVVVDGALRPVGAVVLPRGAHRRLLLAHHAEPPVRARTAEGVAKRRGGGSNVEPSKQKIMSQD